MTDFYPAAITDDTAVAGTVMCDAWFDATDWAPECDALQGRDPDVFATAASEVLYLATGSRWPGVCESVVRPCSGACGCWLDGSSCDSCRLPCDLVKLPSPIRSIAEVLVDGTAIDPATYRIVNGQYLQRLDRMWPSQNFGLAPGERGTWSVQVRFGAVPPPLGVVAAKSLACWMATADSGAACELPAHVTALTRQGINQQFDPKLAGGLTLASVDLFLRSYAVGPPDVWSPDLPQLPPEVLP